MLMMVVGKVVGWFTGDGADWHQHLIDKGPMNLDLAVPFFSAGFLCAARSPLRVSFPPTMCSHPEVLWQGFPLCYADAEYISPRKNYIPICFIGVSTGEFARHLRLFWW